MSCDNDIFYTLMGNRVSDAITSQNILTSYFITEMTLSSWALVVRHSVCTELDEFQVIGNYYTE